MAGVSRSVLTLMVDHGRVAQELAFQEPVARWIRVRSQSETDDPPFERDSDGFLPEPRAMSPVVHGELIRPDGAAKLGALVLLGDPGAGKTTTFESLTGAGPDTPPPDLGQSGTIWTTGSELSDTTAFNSIIGDHLAALPDASANEPRPPELTIVVDQLDESPELLRLHRRFERGLTGKDTRSLRVLVACRTADYPERLTVVLKKALERCVIADLAPLTRADVAILASSVGTDPSAFVDSVVSNGVGTLASVPLTLKILLAAYRHDAHCLAKGPVALFALGVSRLADEHDRDRAPIASVAQRLMIASRISTRLLLCGQRTIWTGPHALAGDHDITDDMLSGGTEDSGGIFAVTPALVGETLKTALFSRNCPNRVEFAHSSFAAFLTGRYLASRLQGLGIAAKRQLADVFLVAAPDEDTASIPVHLRETAAWLLAHAPQESRWLAEADPEGLMAHSAYITDPASREVMVEELLRRASEVELAESSWKRTPWHAEHPGLAGQLIAVLNHAVSSPSTEWADFAKTRLAIHLARDCANVEIADSLLRLAETDGWPISLRQSAAQTAMETAPAQSVSRLRDLLASLAIDTSGPEVDDNELVGTLLALLWPDHLELVDALRHVHPLDDRPFYGMYRWQIHLLPRAVREADLPMLLTFTHDLLKAIFGVSPDRAIVSDDVATAASRAIAASRQATRLTISEFVTPVIDRVMSSPNIGEHLPKLTELMAGLLYTDVRPTIPMAIDLEDKEGREPDQVRDLRRSLAENLTEYFLDQTGQFDRYHGSVVVSHWGQLSRLTGVEGIPDGFQRAKRVLLLDDGDFAWALERADQHLSQGKTPLSNAMGVLAAAVFDRNNPTSVALALARRDKPEWKHFPWLHDEASRDNSLARPVNKVAPNSEWEDKDKFVDLQRKRLKDAVTGDTTSFWLLVKNLHVDLSTGQYRSADPHDVMSLPGIGLWEEEDFRSAFHMASRHYLSAEHDHRDDWLGNSNTDYRAEAGYTALGFAHSTQSLNDLDIHWSDWVGAIADKTYLINNVNVAPLIKDLVRQVLRHAPTELTAAIGLLVRRSLTDGRTPWALAALTSVIPPAMHGTLTDLATEVEAALGAYTDGDAEIQDTTTTPESTKNLQGRFLLPNTPQALNAAVTTWSDLLHIPLISGDSVAKSLAERAVVADTPGAAARLAVEAARILVLTDTADIWPLISQELTARPVFAHDLAAACSADTNHRNTITEALTDDQLVEAYQWLANICPPNTEVYKPGGQILTDRHHIHDWRNTVLSILSKRSTPRAVRGIRTLVDAYPDALALQAALVLARRNAQAQAATVLTLDHVIALLADPYRRIVQTAVQLTELVAQVIADIASDLDSHANLLWDCERVPRPAGAPSGTRRALKWRPKPEGSLAAYIAHELLLRLHRRGIVINREVVVKPTDAGDAGERPDIVVDALASPREADASTISIPIEIKGSWHPNVATAQQTQLAGKYLSAMHTDAGIYLVGWYPLELWDADDGRKSAAGKLRSAAQLRMMLEAQALDIHEQTGKRTVPCIVTVARASSTMEYNNDST